MKNSYHLLSVSPSAKFGEQLLSLLKGTAFEAADLVDTATEAKKKLVKEEYDVVVINHTLHDSGSIHLALDICENSASGVLILVPEENYRQMTAQLAPAGVFVLSKPTSTKMLLQALGLLAAMHERLSRSEKQTREKTASVEEKIAEIKIINRAKWLLIDQLKMTEQQAHRYIEKQAMDRCVTRRAIAENIMKIYNDGGMQS